MKKLCIFFFFCSLSAGVLAQGAWVQKAGFGGTARLYAAGFSIGTKGYIGTGSNYAGAFQKDFWEYNSITNAWTQKADFGGSARQSAVGFSIGNRGYIGTGYDYTFKNDFWEYYPSTNIWTQKANFGGGGRSAATGFSVGTKGYIGTGEQSINVSTKDFWEWDQATDIWTQKMNFGGTERSAATGFSIGAKGYIVAGYNLAGTKDFWEFDPIVNSWTQKSNFPGSATHGSAGFSIGAKGYVGTGEASGSPTGDFWEWDQSANTWTQKTNIAGAPRYGAVGFSIGSKGYIGVGYNSVGINDFWQFNPWNYGVTLSSDSICAGVSMTFTNITTDPDAYRYEWWFIFPSGTDTIYVYDTLTTTLQHVFDSVGGIYNVQVAVFDINNVQLGIFSKSIYVSKFNPLVLVAAPDTCTGGVGRVNVNITGATLPYTYLWSNNTTNQAISNLSPASYSVTISDALGCSVPGSVSIGVYTSTISPTLSTAPDTCLGNVGAFNSPTGGTAPYSFAWNNGSTTGQSAAGLSAGTYTVAITDKNGCAAVNIGTVAVFASSIAVSFNSIPANCLSADGSLTANPSGGTNPYSYVWLGENSSQTANNLFAGTYTVNVTDKNGCTATNSSLVGTSSVIVTPAICMVTVDSVSKNNVILWDKTSYGHIDSFIVYREVGVNNYQRIGAVPYDSLSLFVDTVRTKYFPNTGDPNAGTYRYKLGMKDSCGNISVNSPYHNTIYIINSSGAFSWTQHYTIERAANPVISYILMRDDLSNGNWHAINSVSGTQQNIIDPNYLIYQSTGSWRVETQWAISCNPTIKDPQVLGYNTSRSNIYSLVNGMPEYYNNPAVSIYPNPSSGQFVVCGLQPGVYSLEIYDVYGKCVFQTTLDSKPQTVTPLLSSGMYFYKISDQRAIISTGKLVIQ